MSLINKFRSWLSLEKSSATDDEHRLRKLLRASLEIVSAYGAVLEAGTNRRTLTGKQPESNLPFSKQQILQAITLLQQAVKHPKLRASLIESLTPEQAQQVLSSDFERGLESGLVFLDTFVPAAEAEVDRKQWNDMLKLMDQIDPELRERFVDISASVQQTDKNNK